MKMNKRILIMTQCGLRAVQGEMLNSDFAITFIPERDMFNVTHVRTGVACHATGFSSYEETVSNAADLMKVADDWYHNDAKAKRFVEVFDYCVKHNVCTE